MSVKSLLQLLTLVAMSTASPAMRRFTNSTSSSSDVFYPSNAHCQEYSIPVSVATQAYTWNQTRWQTNEELMDYVSIEGGRQAKPPSELFDPPSEFTADYTIAATFCTPRKQVNGKEDIVLLAGHGLFYSRSYWSSKHKPEKYNFVQYAANLGYSVFMYDRVGVGASSKISGFDAQALVQINILKQLSAAVREGQYTGNIGKPSKLVLIGHAFSSFLTAGFITQTPDVADAVILTTFTSGANLGTSADIQAPRIASTQRPKQWADLDPGYITWPDKFQNIRINYKLGAYDDATVEYSEQTKTPCSLLEPLTQNMLNTNATQFAGPLLIIDGEYAATVCGGYCPPVINSALSVFTSASPLQITQQDGCGHALNFCSYAPAIFQTMFQFLQNNGL